MVSLPLKNGADIEALTNDSETPLARAADQRCIEVVKLLLDYGASKRVINKYRSTLFLIASHVRRLC